MSIIRCSESCAHQKDGYCTVDSAAKPTGEKNAPCEFYEKQKDKKNGSQ